MFYMRINGDLLDNDLLASFDGQLRASVSASLCGDLPGPLLEAGHHGGLLWRSRPPRGPWSRPSRVCRQQHHVSPSTMVDHFSAAFSAPRQPIMAEYDTRTDEALSRLVSTLPAAVAQNLVAQLNEALAERELLWRNVLSGPDAVRDLPIPSLRQARGITPDDGDGDEHPLARKRMKIQSIITACVDSG